jgi:hypothetical protein
LAHVYQQQRERDSSSPKISYTPPSIAVQSQAGYLSSPTTYGPPPSAGGGGSNGGIPRSSFGSHSPVPLDTPQSASAHHSAFPPQTPAYPAYPSYASASPLPHLHVPVSSLQSGAVGPSVEIKRQRRFGAGRWCSDVVEPWADGYWRGERHGDGRCDASEAGWSGC